MTQGPGNKFGNEQHQVVDFTEIRAQKMEEKRRKTERIFFKSLLSVYTVVGDSTMFPIELIDVSEDGCSFQIPHDPDSTQKWPSSTDQFPLRLYFSQDTYLEVQAKIENSRPSIDGNRRYVRYGCKVDQNTASYPAFLQFVRFLKAYSEQAHKDKGDTTVFYL